MKNALEWIKSNPISVASAGVAFVGLLVFVYFYLFAAPGFRADKAEVLKGPETTQKSLISYPVPLPNADPNAPPDEYNVVINQKVIQDVKTIYDEIRVQYEAILDKTGDKNSSRHLVDKVSDRSVLLVRGAIWPDSQNFALYEQAKADYLEHFKALFTYGQDEGWNMPSMVAGSPPQPLETQRTLAQTAFNFINSIGVTSAAALSQEQAEQLYAEQRMELMNLLTNRAKSIHLYAQLPREQDIFAPSEDELAAPQPGQTVGLRDNLLGGGPDRTATTRTNTAAGYPFRIAPWAYAGDRPSPDRVWEGQVQLWIIRDVMQAIHDMNNVGQMVTVTNADGEQVRQEATVLTSPIKRLLVLDVLPGYVGLHSAGGVVDSGTSSDRTGDLSRGMDLGLGDGSSGFSPETTRGTGTTTAETGSVYPTPPSTLSIPTDPTVKAPEHFGITPTGRVSNSVFDVRHTRLVIDIAWDQLPAFIEQLRDTNFMTVVKLNLQDIDEYEVLRNGGYVYGDADVVRAELVIESLWFRNWTAELMPESVKQKMLFTPAAAPIDPTGMESTF